MLRAQKGRAYSRAYARALEKFFEYLKLLEHYPGHGSIRPRDPVENSFIGSFR